MNLKQNKKMITFLCAAAIGICAGGCANQPSQSQGTNSEYNPEGLIDYMKTNPTTWMSVDNGYWSEDKADQPSDEELTKMLDTAMMAQLAVQFNEVYCVVLKDYQDQFDVIGDYWDHQFKAVGKSVTDGTVTVLFYADKVLPQEQHLSPYGTYVDADGVENPAGSMYSPSENLAYMDAGITMAYLQFAAHSMGYNTHIFGGLYGDAAKNQPTKYIDGKNLFRGWGFVHEYGEDIKDMPLDGNMKLIGAVVIGKPSEEVDVNTAASMHMRPSNYNFYDGVPGTPVEIDSNVSDEPEQVVTDGSYTAIYKSQHGDVTIEVVISDGKISSVEAVEGKDNLFMENEQYTQYVQAIIDADSSEIDVIAGATLDCQGISAAVKEAVNK